MLCSAQGNAKPSDFSRRDAQFESVLSTMTRNASWLIVTPMLFKE